MTRRRDLAPSAAEAKAAKMTGLVQFAKAAGAQPKAVPRAAAGAPTPPIPAGTPRRPPSVAVRAARVLQGRYMGLLRTVRPESVRERIRRIARREGFPAAITEMERLRAAPPARRRPKAAQPAAADTATPEAARTRRPKSDRSPTERRIARLLPKLSDPIARLEIELLQLTEGNAAAVSRLERLLGLRRPAAKAPKPRR